MKTKLFFRGIMLFLMMGCMSVYSQNLTFSGSSSGVNEITSTLPCFDATATASSVPEGYVIDNVTLNITHTFDADLDISIIAPNGGPEIELTTDNGGSGDNYTETIFRMDAATAIAGLGFSAAPFTGEFIPEGDLGDADGLNLNGDWILRVCDDFSGDDGTLISWSITFAPGPDCEAAIVSGELVEDCDNNQYFINILVTKKGDGTEINYGMPITSTPMPEDGQSVQLGPFPSGVSTTVVISHDNGEDPDPLGSACNYELGTFSASCPPPNDDCPSALVLECGDSAFGDTTQATNVGAPTSFCGTTPGNSGVWYSFVGTGGDVTVSTDNPGTDYDTKLNVYSGTCVALVCVGGNDDGGTGLTSEFTFASNAGETYYIYVNGFSSSTGSFELSVVCALSADIAEDCTTVYSGYAPTACTDITVETQNGVAPLSYLWSNGDTTPTINVCPTETTIYSVTVTDADSNTASDSTVVVVVDAGCDTAGNEDKVEICHKGNTICVSASAVEAHLNHGDSVGACEGTLTCDTVPGCAVVTNPADGAVDVSTGTQIDWSTAPGYVEGYTISVGTTSGGTDVADNVDVGLTNSFDPGTLDFSTTYYVNVTPYNGNGSASGCAESSFTTEADPCTLASPVDCNSTTLGNTEGASASDLDFCGTSFGDAGGRWFTFIGDGNAVSVSTCSANTNYDTKLGVFTGDCGSLVCEGGDDDASCTHSFLHSTVEFNSVAGTEYKIYVSGFGTSEGDFELSVECILPPANDECEGAFAIACGGSDTGSTTAASVSNPGFCDFSTTSQKGVWYEFAGTGDDVTVSLNGSNYDTRLNVYSGSCGALVCVDGDDDSGEGLDSELTFSSVDGTTYYFYVYGFSSTSAGDYVINVTCAAPPNEPIDLQGTNDCADAPQVTCGQPVNGTTTGYSDSDPIFCGTDNTAPGVWYKLDGPGGSVTASTCNNANYDTKLSIYTGNGTDPDCANLACVAGNDDGSGCSGFTSEVSFETTAGQSYYIYVHGFSSASGDFTLSVTCDNLAPIANPMGNGETISWGMSPNPSIGTVDLDLRNFLNADVTIDVLDFTGKVLSTHKLEDLQNPKYRIQLHENLTDGMYLVRLSSQQHLSAKRLILNR